MKQTLKTIIRNVKSIKGNSLAEFATTTALMATLAATAAPKLSEMSEGGKAEKSRNEIDKIIKQAGQFYQDKAETEGRGRFPGQVRHYTGIGSKDGTAYSNATTNTVQSLADAHTASDAHEDAMLKDLGLSGVSTEEGWQQFNQAHEATWVSVFGTSNADARKALPSGVSGVIDNTADGIAEWKGLFGGETLGSTFQDGHYVYSVIAGGGTGSNVYPPIMYVGDIENMTHFNNLLEP